MPINYEDYLSTSIRWAMFKSDWPDATVEFSEGKASDVGIPQGFSKQGELLCIAKLSRFAGDTQVVTTYKSQNDVRGSKDTDSWHALCSKAMGRALKKAGYPDTQKDLKMLMDFRSVGDSSRTTTIVASQPNNSATSKKSVVAGNVVVHNSPVIESKENPRPRDTSWKSDDEMDNAHATFKAMVSDLQPEQRDALRDHHDKLNGKKWPMEKGDLNNMIIAVESIRATISDAFDANLMFATEPLKEMFTLLGKEQQAEVIMAFGKPETWQEFIDEAEYHQMFDIFEASEEKEDSD